MDRIKVCHIITRLELGGAQGNTIYTVENLDREKYDAFLISGKGGALDGEMDHKKFRTYFLSCLVREVRPYKDLCALFQLYHVLKKEKPEIVHTHSSKAGILGRWAAYFAGVPVIIHTFHGFGFHPYQKFPVRWAYVLAEKITAKITEGFIAVSGENIRTAEEYKLVNTANCILINSGIEKHRFETAGGILRGELSISDTALLVGQVSCLKPQKNPLLFVRVAAALSEKYPDMYFFIAGAGEMRKSVEAEIKKRGLEKKLYLLGDRREIEDVMASADILVLTSRYEGLPRVALEAKALGKPFVASAVDGTREAVEDGTDGFLVGPEDEKGFIERISSLAENPELRKTMGENARRSFRPEYDIAEMVKKIDGFYQKQLSGYLDG